MNQTVEVEAESHLSDVPGCSQCGRTLRQGWSFPFRVVPASPGAKVLAQVGGTVKCILCVVRHLPMIRRSLMVGAVVGTILTLLNQGDSILTGNLKSALYWKIPLTYCVPFCVATFGALTNSRR